VCSLTAGLATNLPLKVDIYRGGKESAVTERMVIVSSLRRAAAMMLHYQHRDYEGVVTVFEETPAHELHDLIMGFLTLHSNLVGAFDVHEYEAFLRGIVRETAVQETTPGEVA
jgi:hypothetical protein